MQTRVTRSEIIKKIITQAPEETAGIARDFGKRLRSGDVVAFYGDLGSGKTFFIQNICRELQAMPEVTSPSFTILNVYSTESEREIYHFDFFRLENDAELTHIGLDDYFYNDYICLIEWADKIQPYLPPRRYEVFIDFIEGYPDHRRIEISLRD